jgi:translation initiation factor eIF-2B subunit gamma
MPTSELPVYKCMAYLLPSMSLAHLSNNTNHYQEINKYLATLSTTVHFTPDHNLQTRGTRSEFSVVDQSTKITDRTNLRKSTIGKHCKIGKGVRLVGCVLMDYVEIGEDVKMDGCIVCVGGKVGEKAVLKDCIVSAGVVVDGDGMLILNFG